MKRRMSVTSHLWCWSDIVNPQLVEQALADDERRARRRLEKASNDPAADGDRDRRPVAA